MIASPARLSSKSSSAALLATLAWSLLAPFHARAIEPTEFLYDQEGRPVGTSTDEPGLYFLIPSRWSLPGSRTLSPHLTAVTDEFGETWYDLRLVLTPDYARAAATVFALRQVEPEALFFPLPMAIERVICFLPDALGGIEAELTPDDEGFDTPVALYYRFRFSEPQLASLRMAARSGLALQGAVEYSYAASSGTEESAAPLTIVLDENALLQQTSAPPADAWLVNLLSSTHLHVPRPLDGSYALGGGVRVSITDSLVEAQFTPGSWSLAHTGSRFMLTPSAPSNMQGVVQFRVPTLGFQAYATLAAAVTVDLELSTMTVQIERFVLTGVQINGVSNSFYRSLLRKMFDAPAVRARISEALSAQLQSRILSQTLFGLEEVW